MKNKFLIITSSGHLKRNALNKFNILKQFEITDFEVFELNSYPTIRDIKRFLLYYKKINFDNIVALGGGSVLDFAKIISNIEQFDVSKLEEQDYKFLRKNYIETIPILFIPTTHGSGAETTSFATLWDFNKNTKYSLTLYINDNSKVVYIPEIALTIPEKLNISTTFDSMCHSIDSLLNINKSNVSIENSLKSLKIICENFEQSLINFDNIPLRLNLFKASKLAGQAINITKTSITHSISYPLTLNLGIPHGLACSFSILGISEFLENEIGVKETKKINELVKKVFQYPSVKEEFIKIFRLKDNVIFNSSDNSSRLDNFIYKKEASMFEIFTKSKKSISNL